MTLDAAETRQDQPQDAPRRHAQALAAEREGQLEVKNASTLRPSPTGMPIREAAEDRSDALHQDR